MKLTHLIYILLIICNILSLYLIIDLSYYDELVGYLDDGREKFDNPQQTAIIIFFTCMINLLFICANLMKSIILKTTIQ